MGTGSYYEELKSLARAIRAKHGVATSTLGLAVLRRVCFDEGVTKIDLWKPKLRKVRAAYMAVDDVSCILLNANIPDTPRLFSLAHELKHHLCDRDAAQDNPLGCEPGMVGASSPEIEIGAEVFAAELIFPDAECRAWIDRELGDRACSQEDVVHLKRCCPAKVSYAFLVKRLEWFRRVERGTFANVQFQKLEERMFGVPFYRARKKRGF